MNLTDIVNKLLGIKKDFQAKEELWHGALFHRPTQAKRGGLRHRPYTKAPLTGESKKHRKLAARSRKINRRLK